MLRLSLLLLGMAACTSMQAAAQITTSAEQVSNPGYVNYNTPISLFVSPALVPACDALQKHDFVTAEKTFGAEVQQHPDNFAAWLGLLQAAKGHRNQWLSRFTEEVMANPTAANHFKLGLLSWYQYAENTDMASPLADPKISTNKKQKLRDTARTNLEAAYRMSYAPVAGFSLASSSDCLHSNPLPIYEDLLQRVGGEGVYQAYLYAKKDEWRGEQPPIPRIPRNGLLILERTVAFIWSKNSGRFHVFKQRTVNGQSTTIDMGPRDYTSTQVQAKIFLNTWRERLKAAAAQTPQVATFIAP